MLWIDIKYDLKWHKDLTRRTQEMIDVAGEEVVRGIKRNIRESISIYGGNLAPLKPETIRKKRGMRHPKRPLHALGMLYRNIHYYRGHRPGMGQVGIKNVGSPSRRLVAIAQQTGAYRGGVPRPFFGITPYIQKRIDGAITGWIARLTRGRVDSVKKGTIIGR